VKLSRLETHLFAFLAGAACLSTLVFVLCVVHLARKGIFILISVVALAAAARQFRRGKETDDPFLSLHQLMLFLLPFVPYAVLYFINALKPESSADGVGYHLGSVMRWWLDRGFIRYTGHLCANYPQGLELLFLVAFSIGKHSAATLVHFVFLLVLPWLMVSYALRFGGTRPFVAGAVLVFVSPVVGIAGTCAYNDVAVACLAFGLFYVLELWGQSGDERFIVVAGLLAGFGYAVKYTMAIGVIYGIGLIAWRLWQKNVKGIGGLRPIGVFLLFAAIPAMPWMIKNLIWVSNPFSPFLNSWFPNPYVHIWSEKELAKAMALYAPLQSRWELPLAVSVRGAHVGGLFGPWMLLTPLSLLSLRSPQGRRLLAAATVFGLPFLGNSSTRLLFPFAVFGAPALGIALESLAPILIPAVVGITALASWPEMAALYAHEWAWRITGMPVAAALRIVPEEKHLRASVDGYDVALAIEESTPKHARILRFSAVPQAYTTRRLWGTVESAEGELAFLWLWSGFDQDLQPSHKKTFRFPAVSLQAVRIVAREERNELWSVNEMRVYLQGHEVRRQPGWGASATPNPWDAARAFDDNEATFWSTWQAVEPGMWLQERFGSLVTIDEVSAECANHCGVDLYAEGLGIDGHWRMLESNAAFEQRQVASGMRQAAMDAVRSLGFDYIVARDDSRPGKDFLQNSDAWGLESLRSTMGGRIFRIR
jgi:hypothetical protein